jgi:hypothetical protein
VTRARDVATQGGLVLVSSSIIGTAVSSVVVSNAFSATYDNYKIIVSGGVASTSTSLRLQLGASTSTYNYIYFGVNNSGTADIGRVTSASSFAESGGLNTNYITANLDLINPFLTKYTQLIASVANSGPNGFNSFGFHGTETSYTGFTLTTATGTMTGGTIKVYGYK